MIVERNLLLVTESTDVPIGRAIDFSFMAFGVGCSDAYGHIVHVDDVFARILGRSTSEIVGKQIIDFVATTYVSHINALYKRLSETGSPFSVREELVRPDRSRVPVFIHVCSLRSEDGAASGSVSICQPASLASDRPSIVAEVVGPPAIAPDEPLLGGQVRAARGWLGWSVRELSQAADVSSATINRFESEAGPASIRDSTLTALHRTLAARGMRFFRDRFGNPVVSKGSAEKSP